MSNKKLSFIFLSLKDYLIILTQQRNKLNPKWCLIILCEDIFEKLRPFIISHYVTILRYYYFKFSWDLADLWEAYV